MCFKERNSKVCGNSRVEDGEECDPGLLHLNDDPCCSSDCKFKRGAQCRYEIQKAGLIVQNTFVKSKYTLKLWINWSKWGCQSHMRSHVSVLSTATETALAVGIASLRRREQGARKPLMQPAKAFPLAQVCTTGVTRELQWSLQRYSLRWWVAFLWKW